MCSGRMTSVKSARGADRLRFSCAGDSASGTEMIPFRVGTFALLRRVSRSHFRLGEQRSSSAALHCGVLVKFLHTNIHSFYQRRDSRLLSLFPQVRSEQFQQLHQVTCLVPRS